MRVNRNDPHRAGLHDYFLVDPQDGRDLAGFDNQPEAMAYAIARLRGQVTVLQVAHPAGCTCQAGQGLCPDGRAVETAVGAARPN